MYRRRTVCTMCPNVMKSILYNFIQLVVINWLLGFFYDHFLNKNIYACGYKIFPLVLEVTKICLSFNSLLSYLNDLSNSRKYFIHHRHNILIRIKTTQYNDMPINGGQGTFTKGAKRLVAMQKGCTAQWAVSKLAACSIAVAKRQLS